MKRKPALDPGIGQAQAPHVKADEKQFPVNRVTAASGGDSSEAGILFESNTTTDA
jgi:hypothetical protein